MSIIVIAVVAFIVWHFLPKRGPFSPTPKYRREQRALASDPNWQVFIEEHCESPAETAFLTAMVEAHGLLPDNGSLKTAGLKLDFQVEVARYRLDFLANDWLIIEIDGAQWHSSEQAKARDATRDGFFIDLGYSVIRIPAKVVFSNPSEAVSRVSEALSAGKPIIAKPVQSSGLTRLRQTASLTGGFMSNIADSIERAKQVKEALGPSEMAYNNEKRAIESAIESAKLQVNMDDELASDEESRAFYQESMTHLSAALEKSTKRSIQAASATLSVRPYTRPQLTGYPETDLEIVERFDRMSAEREAYFEGIRNKVVSDARLVPHVKEHLTKLGCGEVWSHIS